MTDIADRRVNAEVELQALRRKRGSAHLDKQKFDVGKIDALKDEIETLDSASDELVLRDRAEHQREFSARRSQLKKELAKLESERQGFLQDANISARALCENITMTLETTRRMSEICCALSAEPAPVVLMAPDVVTRLAGRLCAVMSSIPGHRNRFGHLIWQAGVYKAAEDWRTCESTLIAPHLENLLKGK